MGFRQSFGVQKSESVGSDELSGFGAFTSGLDVSLLPQFRHGVREGCAADAKKSSPLRDADWVTRVSVLDSPQRGGNIPLPRAASRGLRLLEFCRVNSLVTHEERTVPAHTE